MRPAAGSNANEEDILIQSMDLTRSDVLLDDTAQLLNVPRPESPVGTDAGPEQLSRHFARTKANYFLIRVSACQSGVTQACSQLRGEITGMEQLRSAIEPLWSFLCAHAPANTDKAICQTE